MITRRELVVSGVGSAALLASGNAKAFWPLLIRIVLGGIGRRTAFTVSGAAVRSAGARTIGTQTVITSLPRRSAARSYARPLAEEFTTQAMGDVFDAYDPRSRQVTLEVNNPNDHYVSLEPIMVKDRDVSTGSRTETLFSRVQAPPGHRRITLNTARPLDVGTYERSAWFPQGTSAQVSYSPLWIAVEGEGYRSRVAPPVACPILVPYGTEPHWRGQSLCDAAMQDANLVYAGAPPVVRKGTLEVVGDFIIQAGVIHLLTR